VCEGSRRHARVAEGSGCVQGPPMATQAEHNQWGAIAPPFLHAQSVGCHLHVLQHLWEISADQIGSRCQNLLVQKGPPSSDRTGGCMPPVPSLCNRPTPGGHGKGLSEAGEGIVVELSMEQKKTSICGNLFWLEATPSHLKPSSP
jgi:hypothetical protein